LFVGCQAASAGTLKAEQPGLAFDIGLLSPDRHVSYLNRRATQDFIPRLSQYLFDAAAQFHPEQTLPAFTVDNHEDDRSHAGATAHAGVTALLH